MQNGSQGIPFHYVSFREQLMATQLIVTCSAFLAKPGKLDQLTTAIASLLARHTATELAAIRELVVINEYAPNGGADYRSTIQALHPRLEFIQKGAADQGQARTLNMILERTRGYEHWIHWEESWECTRPFLSHAVDIIESTRLTQLQLTPDWLDIEPQRIVPSTTPEGTRYANILPHPMTKQLLRGTSIDDYDTLLRIFGLPAVWPLFSLRPSINLAPFCRDVGPFNEKPQHWPVRFEWDYAARWFARGATKAVLLPHAAQRQSNHVSTYG